MDGDIKIPQIVFMGNSIDSRHAVTKHINTVCHRVGEMCGATYGSAIKRSVSFTILFGRTAIGTSSFHN